MSLSKNESITCPECGTKGEFTVWESINTDLDPEMFNLVRTGDAFKYTCPKCEKCFNVDYGFLYHQMKDKLMIQYSTTDENEQEALGFIEKIKQDAFDDMSELVHNVHKGYLNRIVRSMNHFKEKLYIFDAGLDDRVIEIIKIFYLSQISNENPDIGADEVLFFIDDNGTYNVQFFSNGNPVASGPVGDDMYKMIKEEYIDNLPDIRDDNVIIDFNWALKRINDKEK